MDKSSKEKKSLERKNSSAYYENGQRVSLPDSAIMNSKNKKNREKKLTYLYNEMLHRIKMAEAIESANEAEKMSASE